MFKEAIDRAIEAKFARKTGTRRIVFVKKKFGVTNAKVIRSKRLTLKKIGSVKTRSRDFFNLDNVLNSINKVTEKTNKISGQVGGVISNVRGSVQNIKDAVRKPPVQPPVLNYQQMQYGADTQVPARNLKSNFAGVSMSTPMWLIIGAVFVLAIVFVFKK